MRKENIPLRSILTSFPFVPPCLRGLILLLSVQAGETMKGKRDVPEMSNADLKRMLDQTMIRFENWRIEEIGRAHV